MELTIDTQTGASSGLNIVDATLEHEQVLVGVGARSGLPIAVAVHSTVLGQALGGARMWPYSHWTNALADALRLSRAMTLKNAAAGLNHGGGKAVICLPTERALSDSERNDVMRDLGDAVEALGGIYMTTEDVGTSAELMSVVAECTSHVCGLPVAQGGAGEPAEATAYGVHVGLRATAEALFGTASLAGRHIVISGLGQVGSRLARLAHADGARLTVTDIDDSKRSLAEELGAEWGDPATIHRTPGDLFAPCGLGGVLTESVVDELVVAGVAGAANNQLDAPERAEQLRQRSILWAPDFIVNGGGVIHLALAAEYGDPNDPRILQHVAHVGDRLTQVFSRATQEQRNTLVVAEQIVADRLAAPQGIE